MRAYMRRVVPPFPVRVTIVGLSVGLATPLYAVLGVASLWVRVLPKTALGQTIKNVCAVGIGGGFLTLAYNYIVPFLLDHGDVLLPFALANTVAASFWYGLLDLLLGYEAIFASPAAATGASAAVASKLFASIEKSVLKLFSVFPLLRHATHTPIAGVTVGLFTALTAPLLWSRCIDLCWTEDFKALVFGHDPTGSSSGGMSTVTTRPAASTSLVETEAEDRSALTASSTLWLADLYNHTLLVPVGLPIGAMAGVSIHYALRPLLTGAIGNSAQRPWSRVALPAAVALVAVNVAYFKYCRPYIDDFLWVQRLDPSSSQIYSFNVRTSVSVKRGNSVLATATVSSPLPVTVAGRPLDVAYDSENYRSFFYNIRGWSGFASGLWGSWNRGRNAEDEDEDDEMAAEAGIVKMVGGAFGLAAAGDSAKGPSYFPEPASYVNYDVNGLLQEETKLLPPSVVAATLPPPRGAITHPHTPMTLRSVDEVTILYHFIDVLSRYRTLKLSSPEGNSEAMKDFKAYCLSRNVGISDVDAFITNLGTYYHVWTEYETERLRRVKALGVAEANVELAAGGADVAERVLIGLENKLVDAMGGLRYSDTVNLWGAKPKSGKGVLHLRNLRCDSRRISQSSPDASELNRQYRKFIVGLLIGNIPLVANHLFSATELAPITVSESGSVPIGATTPMGVSGGGPGVGKDTGSLAQMVFAQMEKEQQARIAQERLTMGLVLGSVLAAVATAVSFTYKK
jgi:hypothetical protein